MASFFQNLYKYKQSELRHQKENFTTEILAQCLRVDNHFRNRFLKLIGCNQTSDLFNCQTQFLDKDFGKPDILIQMSDNTVILVECKVDALQGETQLDRYAKFLQAHSATNKHLIFLTRFAEDVVDTDPNLNFQHIRWYDIFDQLKDSPNSICKEFTNYLIEQKMSTEISFTMADKNALKSIRETIAKMDEFLLHLKDILCRYSKNKIVHYKKPSHGNYGISIDTQIGDLWLGLFEYEHNDEMQVCIELNIPKKLSRNAIGKFLELNNWNTYDENDYIVWYNAKGLSTFFVDNTFNVRAACDYINDELTKIKRWI